MANYNYNIATHEYCVIICIWLFLDHCV